MDRASVVSATETSFPSLLILIGPHRLIALILDSKKIGWINVGIRVPQGWKNIQGKLSSQQEREILLLSPIQKLFGGIVTNSDELIDFALEPREA